MLITFEGPDGCGKTTQLTLLAETLKQQGFETVATREPGGTGIGEQVRAVLHDLGNKDMHPRAEILLYSASRAQLVEELIRPALAEGKVVLCDRFFDSTFAYQGYGHQLDLDALRAITVFATGGLRPDLTLYIEISPEDGLRRRQADTKAEWNRLDAQSAAFHQRVYEGYKALIQAEPERWVVIEGNRSIEDVQAAVLAAVTTRLEAAS